MNYELTATFPRDASCMRAILRQRKVENVEDFLRPTSRNELSPTLLDNIDEAINLIEKHLKENNRICIVVDSDADGYTSSAVLYMYLKKVYPRANLTYTLHSEKQHGLEDKVGWVIEQKFDLVICPDAASFDGEYLQQLKNANIDFVALDHHSLPANYDMKEETPDGMIIVNNQLCDYPNKEICGVGIVYKMCKKWDERAHTNYAQNYIDLVSIGNIADVMFMGESETRYYIIEGLNNIKNEGLKALIKAQERNLKDKIDDVSLRGMTPLDGAFLIAPLINAIIRIGSEKEKEILFLSLIESQERIDGSKPSELLTLLAPTIRTRQNQIKEKATKLLEGRIHEYGLDENNIIVVQIEEEDKIPNTMTGLIAGNLLSDFNRPIMLVRENSEGELCGSQRSNSNFEGLSDFRSFLEDSGLMISAVGHPNASGVSFKKSNLSNLLKYANTHLDANVFQNCNYKVDYIFHAYEEALSIVGKEIASHEDCFGNGIDEVHCVVRNVPLSSFRLMGTKQDSTKITCCGNEYVKFRDLDFAKLVLNNSEKTMDIYGKFKLNCWNGRAILQILIEDFELT